MTRPRPTPPAVNKLIDIYLDGLGSGIASYLATFDADRPEADRIAMGQSFVDALRLDPLAMEMVLAQIKNRLMDEGGPRKIDFTVDVPR